MNITLTNRLADALRALLAHVESADVQATPGGGVGAFAYGRTEYQQVTDARETLAGFDALQTLPSNVVFAWGERSALSDGLPLVTMTQQGPDSFTVRYGKQVNARLNYGRACAELGAAVLHALACDSIIDNRTKAEARRDGDA